MSLRDIRNRIRSINQTLKITSAMKLISTSKMRKARKALDQTAPYFDRIREVVRDILSHTAEVPPLYFEDRHDRPGHKTCIVLITSSRGMAGGYNSSVIRMAEQLIANEENPYMITVGSIGQRYFMGKHVPILEDFHGKREAPDMDLAHRMSLFVLSQFKQGLIDDFHVVYTHMYSSVKIVPEHFRLLPLDLFRIEKKSQAIGAAKEKRYSFEPDTVSAFEAIMPHYIEGTLYGALVESYASEQSARMTAMDSATKNANEMLDKLQLQYNRARQASITAEVSEIVSGAAALDG